MSDALGAASASLPAAPRRIWRASPAVRRFYAQPRAVFGLAVIIAMVLACIFGPPLLPFTDTFIDIRHRLNPVFSGAHLLGTDQLGRDILARLLMAGRISLAVGIAAMSLSMAIGVVVGVVAGFYGGLIGAALMRLVDAVLCFPSIFLLLALASLFAPSVGEIIVLISMTAWMEVARVVEGQIRGLRARDFAVASEALGAGDARIMFRELLPNAMAPIVVAATLNVAHAILAESYISFLGYGIQPPTPSWGNMLDVAQSYLGTAPHLAILPGAMIALAVISFNFLGDGLRAALDPRQGGS